MSVLVAGSANLDFVVRVPHVPAPGETVMGGSLQTFPGGKGANQAVACARAGGAATAMLLALGSDAQAAPIEASLHAAGVALHTVRSVTEPTGTAFISLADNAENSIIVAPGANATLRADHLPALQGVSHLLLQLEVPMDTVAAHARQARQAGAAVVLNAAPALPLPPGLLADVDLLIVNEGELVALAGAAGSVAEQLARLALPVVIVTLGARGCCARSAGAWLLQGAFAVQAVDTTAAGDTFCGTLVAALSLGETLPAALRRASAAAALACARLGAQPSIPTRAEVDELLQRTGENDASALAALAAHVGIPTHTA
jgi:ribokinase